MSIPMSREFHHRLLPVPSSSTSVVEAPRAGSKECAGRCCMMAAWRRVNPTRRTRRGGSRSASWARWSRPPPAPLREGLQETLTVQTLAITSALWKTLRNTNPVAEPQRRRGEVHPPRPALAYGAMMLHRVRSALLDSEQKFCRVRRFRQRPALSEALHNRAMTNASKQGRQVA